LTTGPHRRNLAALTKAGQCPQPNFVVNFVVNFVDEVDDNVDDEDAQFLFFITVRDG